MLVRVQCGNEPSSHIVTADILLSNWHAEVRFVVSWGCRVNTHRFNVERSGYNKT